MARVLTCTLLVSAILLPCFLAPSTPRAVPRVAVKAGEAPPEQTPNVSAGFLAVLAGLVLSFAAPSWAGTGTNRPVFQLDRPAYMQGIDAANAATRPGEVDYVTRSRIEALHFPQALKEMEITQQKLSEAPTKEQRVANSLKQLEEYNKVAEIPHTVQS
mmetsp:Transcript_127517/g.303007  ORF Transcript_127517/g.303007 Transcript_127517/m.303007 type:complete len:159 (+) Transcript_127517:89-565(+)